MIACSLALLAFAAATVAGIAVGNPAITTVWRALLAMIGCYAVGSLLGALAERALSEHIDQYKRDHPLEPAATATKDAPEDFTSETQEEPPAAPAQPARRATDQTREATSTDDAPSQTAVTEPTAA